jgi:hypothetical protein
MPRPSKTKEWPNNNKIAIYLKDKDTIQYFETDEKGKVRTKKRAWARHEATVILGAPNVFDDRVEVEEGVLVFECEIFENGDMSPVGYPNKNVTVIVHL